MTDPTHVHLLELTEEEVVEILAHLTLLVGLQVHPFSAAAAANALSQAAWDRDVLAYDGPYVLPQVEGIQ